MPTTHLLYLHGFRSSPQSTKARQMAARVARDHPAVTWWCPQLPPSPRAATDLLLAGTAGWPAHAMAVVGSSLGGFYATWLAERLQCKAVLLNPAVHPERDLAAHIGEHSAWHDPAERFFFEPGFVEELQSLQCQGLAYPAHEKTPGRSQVFSHPLGGPGEARAGGAQYYALLAKGDEVLDWREMLARYSGATVRLLEGSDHALSDFEQHLDAVMEFLDLA